MRAGGLVLVGDNYHKNREALSLLLQKLPRKKKSESRQPEILDAYCCTRRRFLLGLKSHTHPIYHWAQQPAPLYAARADGRCMRSRLGNIRKRARICIVLFCYLHFSGCSVLAGRIKNKLREREIKSEETRGCVGTLHLPELGERVLFRIRPSASAALFQICSDFVKCLACNFGKWRKFTRSQAL